MLRRKELSITDEILLGKLIKMGLISLENCKKYLQTIKNLKERVLTYEDILNIDYLPKNLQGEILKINEDIDNDEKDFESNHKNEDDIFDPDAYDITKVLINNELANKITQFESNYPSILGSLYLEDIDNQEEILFLASNDIITEGNNIYKIDLDYDEVCKALEGIRTGKISNLKENNKECLRVNKILFKYIKACLLADIRGHLVLNGFSRRTLKIALDNIQIGKRLEYFIFQYLMFGDRFMFYSTKKGNSALINKDNMLNFFNTNVDGVIQNVTCTVDFAVDFGASDLLKGVDKEVFKEVIEDKDAIDILLKKKKGKINLIEKRLVFERGESAHDLKNKYPYSEITTSNIGGKTERITVRAKKKIDNGDDNN